MAQAIVTVSPGGHPRRIAVTDVIGRFRAYRDAPGNGAWGSLHCVLDDLNVSDGDVRDAIERARDAGDAEAGELGRILLGMTRTQRLRLADLA